MSILLLISDFIYALMRIILGGLVVWSGYERFNKTRTIGILDLILGSMLIIGFHSSWAALILSIEMVFLVIWKLYRGKRSKEDWSFDLLVAIVSLYIFTQGTGLFSLDEGWLWLF